MQYHGHFTGISQFSQLCHVLYGSRKAISDASGTEGGSCPVAKHLWRHYRDYSRKDNSVDWAFGHPQRKASSYRLPDEVCLYIPHHYVKRGPAVWQTRSIDGYYAQNIQFDKPNAGLHKRGLRAFGALVHKGCIRGEARPRYLPPEVSGFSAWPGSVTRTGFCWFDISPSQREGQAFQARSKVVDWRIHFSAFNHHQRTSISFAYSCCNTGLVQVKKHLLPQCWSSYLVGKAVLIKDDWTLLLIVMNRTLIAMIDGIENTEVDVGLASRTPSRPSGHSQSFCHSKLLQVIEAICQEVCEQHPWNFKLTHWASWGIFSDLMLEWDLSWEWSCAERTCIQFQRRCDQGSPSTAPGKGFKEPHVRSALLDAQARYGLRSILYTAIAESERTCGRQYRQLVRYLRPPHSQVFVTAMRTTVDRWPSDSALHSKAAACNLRYFIAGRLAIWLGYDDSFSSEFILGLINITYQPFHSTREDYISSVSTRASRSRDCGRLI